MNLTPDEIKYQKAHHLSEYDNCLEEAILIRPKCKEFIQVYIIAEENSHQDGHTIRVRKQTSSPEATFRVKPENIMMIMKEGRAS